MAKAKKATFDLRDVAAALFRFEGIHEGRWQLTVDLSAANAHVGQPDQGALPGVMIVFRGVQLQRCDDAADGVPQVFDASKENPRE